MPIGFKGNPLGNYIAPHTSPPLYQSVYNTEGELVFERDIRAEQFGDYMFSNSEVASAIGDTWSVATPYMTSASYMFLNDTNLKTVSESADFSSLTNASYMFQGCTNLESVCANFPNLVNVYHMFYQCKALKHIPEGLDLAGGKMMFGQQMFAYSGLEGSLGKSGYYEITASGDRVWHKPELLTIKGFWKGENWANNTSTYSVNGGTPRGMFQYCNDLEEAYVDFVNAYEANSVFMGCAKLKKLVMKGDSCLGTMYLNGGGNVGSGAPQSAANCSSLEIVDYLSSFKWCGATNCPKLRYFNIKCKNTHMTEIFIDENCTNLITVGGEEFSPNYLMSGSGRFNSTNAKLSLCSVQKLLNAVLGTNSNNSTDPNYIVFNKGKNVLGIGLQEGLKVRTQPSYVIDAGYYDYENGSESTDEYYEHNYYDINGKAVIEHDVHDIYITAEQPDNWDGKWSAVNNGVTYYAIGELRDALDDALGTRWGNITIKFN